MLVCGIAQVEWWPLTGWKLFSTRRTGVSHAWEVVGADTVGREARLPLAELGRPYVAAVRLLDHWPDLDATERLDACEAWRHAAAANDPAVAEVRLYRVERRRRLDEPDRTVVVRRVLHQRCAGP